MQHSIFVLKRTLEYILSRVAAFLLSAMTIMVLIQVVSRYVFQSPTAFTEELVRYLLIWTGFIGAAYAFFVRAHMALVFVREKLPEASRRLLVIFIDAVVLLFAAGVMIYGGIRLSVSVWDQLSPLLGISRGLVYSMAPLSGILIVLAQIINLYEDFGGKLEDSVNKEVKA